VSEQDDIQAWLTEHEIQDVEAFVPDMAGAARGKLIPAAKFGTGELKLPEGIFAQTISGNYVDNKDNIEDRDMILWPDPATLRPVPWATDPAASIFLDCFHRDDTPVETSPRRVLRNVLQLYEEKGWVPVVAPEVEFYLINPHSDANQEVEPPEGRLGWTETSKQPYSIDTMNDFDPFINDVYAYCEAQGIRIDTLSQEMGPAQFELNFFHGNALELADQVFLFRSHMRCTQHFWRSLSRMRPAARYMYTRVLWTRMATTFFPIKTAAPVSYSCRISVACKSTCAMHC
jgi:glutamine synthetase